MNYATMQQEAGLSALALNGENQDKREWYEAYPRRWAAMQVRSYRFLRIKDADIRAWICIADVAGVGGDGEPCITNVKPLAYLSESLVEEAFTETPLF